MIWLWLGLGFTIGVALGRAYSWMKYQYPESVEMINVKVAKLRAERARYEAQEEAARREINDSLDDRIRARL